MERPSTPTGGPPGYSAAPPSYSTTPNEGTPTNMPNNGSTMRLLSSQDDTERRSPASPQRTYLNYRPSSSASSLPQPQSPSILDTAPRLAPTSTDAPSYLPYIPSRGSPTRSLLSRTSSESSRPPPSDIPYEPVDLNGNPRPGSPASKYGGSSKRPLPPAPLFSGPQAASQSSGNLAEATAIPIHENEDDVFGPESGDHPVGHLRPSVKSYESFQSQSTSSEDLYSKEDEDHYGPAPTGRQERRRGARQAQMAKKEVRLINGELILECKIPTILYSFLPRRDEIEFTHMRYTAVTCDPDDFTLKGYKLRQNIGSTARDTELFICITMYNEDEIDFTRTMHGVMRNISHFCSRAKSRTWGKDGWQKIVVCIVSDGRRKVHPRTLDALAAMGVYQDGIAKNLVNQREVTAHVYEYTTQVSLDADLKFKGAEKGIVPCQMIFCLKEKNQKKLNSHRWFFNAFGKALSPNVCILLDVGTKPGENSLYHLWKAFDTDSNVAGACGEIKAAKGKGWLGLLNPLVASQNFEYKMSNILDKPIESVFGYITVLPGALSAYRYYALQNDATGHGPLSQYFKGETLHGQDADVFTANMYLAEDRILCWELANFYLTFYFIAGSLSDPKLDPFGHNIGMYIFVILRFACVLLICTQFILPLRAKKMYMSSLIIYSIIMLYTVFASMYIVVVQLKNPTTSFHLGNNIFTNLIVSTGSTVGIYFLMSFLYLDPWHMFTSSAQYFALLPSYICTLQVYAFCNTHDVSWGTKGDNVIHIDLGAAVSGKGNTVELEMPSEQLDIDSGYDEALRNLRDRLEVAKDGVSEATQQEDYYRAVRTYMVVVWMISNAILAMAVSEAYNSTHITNNFYLKFILWSVACVALFRALGSSAFRIINVVHTIAEGKMKMSSKGGHFKVPDWVSDTGSKVSSKFSFFGHSSLGSSIGKNSRG